MLEISDVEQYKITWVLAAFKRTKSWLGFCGKTRGLIQIRAVDDPTVLIMNDLYATKETWLLCEESKVCLHSDCPLNNTHTNSFWKNMGFRSRPPFRLNRQLRRMTAPEEINCSEGGRVTASQGKPLLKFSVRTGK